MPINQGYKEICQTVINAWDAQGVRLNPGTSEPNLKRFESLYELQLPEDFRYFYSLANGMHSDDCDHLLFSMWSLEEIFRREGVRQSTNDIHPGTEIIFGDFLIDPHRYMLVLDAEGGSSVWTEEHGKASSSFEEFLFLYINDHEKIYLWDLEPRPRNSK